MEFACKIAGLKPWNILGHAVCGTVTGMGHKDQHKNLTTVTTKRGNALNKGHLCLVDGMYNAIAG